MQIFSHRTFISNKPFVFPYFYVDHHTYI